MRYMQAELLLLIRRMVRILHAQSPQRKEMTLAPSMGNAAPTCRRCSNPMPSPAPVRVKWPELASYVKVAAELDLPR